MTVGKRIKLSREAVKMTQEALGAKCGVTKQTIFKYENNIISNIPMDKLETISKELGVTQAYLMGWDTFPTGGDWGDASTMTPVPSNESTRGMSPEERAAFYRGLHAGERRAQEKPPTVSDEGLSRQFINLFNQLTPEQQEFVVSAMKGMKSKE